MDNANSSGRHLVYASQIGAALDSNVHCGGGTDDTAAIQAALDRAPQLGSLKLIMDGAALVRGLDVHSNTTIECLDNSCGFFLTGGANRTILRNSRPSPTERFNRNITLLGGTYNHNCAQQVHHLPEGAEMSHPQFRVTSALEFFGVENLTLRDVTIRDMRVFAIYLTNFFRVTMENIAIDLPGRMQNENQDGIHVQGPGQFLTLRNIQGTSWDDFIAINADDYLMAPGASGGDVTDVLIDGVMLHDAAQGIRLLSRKARLDRIIIRNVQGTYRSFGFYVNVFLPGGEGNFGNILFDTIDLRANEPNYTYTTPFLFRIGGRHENLVLRNITHHNPGDNRSIIDVGWPHADPSQNELDTWVDSLLIDGLRIHESGPAVADAGFIKVLADVKTMVLRHVEVVRDQRVPVGGCLMQTQRNAKIGNLVLSEIVANRLDSILDHQTGNIERLQAHEILLTQTGHGIIRMGQGKVGQLYADGIHETSVTDGP